MVERRKTVLTIKNISNSMSENQQILNRIGDDSVYKILK